VQRNAREYRCYRPTATVLSTKRRPTPRPELGGSINNDVLCKPHRVDRRQVDDDQLFYPSPGASPMTTRAAPQSSRDFFVTESTVFEVEAVRNVPSDATRGSLRAEARSPLGSATGSSWPTFSRETRASHQVVVGKDPGLVSQRRRRVPGALRTSAPRVRRGLQRGWLEGDEVECPATRSNSHRTRCGARRPAGHQNLVPAYEPRSGEHSTSGACPRFFFPEGVRSNG